MQYALVLARSHLWFIITSVIIVLKNGLFFQFDVDKIIRNLREQRHGMIQTKVSVCATNRATNGVLS